MAYQKDFYGVPTKNNRRGREKGKVKHRQKSKNEDGEKEKAAVALKENERLPLAASARNGNRTRTAITGQGILSPSCLPIPPSGHFAVQFANCAAKVRKKVKSEKRKMKNYFLFLKLCSACRLSREL